MIYIINLRLIYLQRNNVNYKYIFALIPIHMKIDVEHSGLANKNIVKEQATL